MTPVNRRLWVMGVWDTIRPAAQEAQARPDLQFASWQMSRHLLYIRFHFMDHDGAVDGRWCRTSARTPEVPSVPLGSLEGLLES